MPPYLSSRRFSSEPPLTPMRIGIPRSFAASPMTLTFEWSPALWMLPGLIRTLATPAAMAAIAYFHWKWMSATTGTVDFCAICASASASSCRGTATRTMSTPAALSAAICCSVALTSCVGVVHIDCTLIGAPSPTGILPTLMRRVARRSGGCRCGGVACAATTGRLRRTLTSEAMASNGTWGGASYTWAVLDVTADRLAALRGMSAQELAALLGRVPGLAAALEGHGHLIGWLRYGVPRGRGPADLALLARVLASPAGLEATLGALTLTELHVLLLAHWAGGALQREAALAEAGARPGSPQAVALDRAAASLHALLLSDGARGWVVLRPGVEGGLALPGVTLRDGLRHWPSEAVAARLRTIGVAAAAVPPRRSERVDLLVAALREPEIARALVADLPEDAARVLARLRLEGLVRVRDLGVAWYSGQRPAYYPETPLDALVARGLAGVDEVQQLAFVWLDVAVALNGGRLFTSWPEATQPTPRPLERQAVAVPAVVAQLDRLLRVWEAEPAPALQDGGLGVRPVRAAARALGLPDGVVGLLAGLAIGLGLLGTVSQGMVGRGRQRREILSWSPTRAAQAWASEPAEERWSRLVAAWLDSDLVDEREGLPERCDPAARESGARPARAELLALLVDLDEGYGLALAELVDVAALSRPRLLEGCVAGLTAAARALGLVPPGGPVGLTDLARRLLHGGPAAARAALPTPSREFVVQADHTVIAPPDLHPEVAATLERYAELESDAGARVYRLTERRLGQALVDGDDGEAIAAFLDEHSRTSVPQNVAYLVADCARRHGRLRAGESRSYLRSEDPGLLTAAAAVRSARLRVLAPTVAISSLPRDKLVAALAARGVVAVPEEHDGAAIAAQHHRADPHWRVGQAATADRPSSLLPDPPALLAMATALVDADRGTLAS